MVCEPRQKRIETGVVKTGVVKVLRDIIVDPMWKSHKPKLSLGKAESRGNPSQGSRRTNPARLDGAIFLVLLPICRTPSLGQTL